MDKKLLGNRYELIEEIGRGGMAVVYKARCTLLNRYVAIKILKQELSNDPDFLKRFHQEAQAAASLSHHNIVSIFDVGHDDDKHYIVMEYINGITLKESIRRKGKLDQKEAINIAIQVIKAIRHAHEHKVVHRDIKPHNILIQSDGTAKVADFGIARATSTATITLSGTAIGSVHYFSPEQARGSVTDFKSDLYSFGATLYEMVTGKLVFEADTPIAVALKQIQDKPKEPKYHYPAINPALNALINRCLEKNPNDRYQSAKAVADSLDLIEAGKKEIKGYKSEQVPKIRRAEGYDIMTAMTRKKDTRDIFTTLISIIVSVVVIALFGYLVFGVVIPSLGIASNEVLEIEVENYVGKQIDDVTKELDDYLINIERTERYDEESKKGEILFQNIRPGNTLKEGSKIKMTISLGPEYIILKDYKNMDYREVERELKNLGLSTIIKSDYDDRVQNGLVIATKPDMQTQLRKGDEVTIYRSLGKEIMEVYVPNLVDVTFEEALELIKENGLILDMAVNYQVEGYSDVIEYQSPSADVKVPEGTEVTVFMKRIEDLEIDEENDEEVIDDEIIENEEDTTDDTTISDKPIVEEEDDLTDSGQDDTKDDTVLYADSEYFYFFDQLIYLDELQLDDTFKLSIETRTSKQDLYVIHFDADFKKADLPYKFKVKVPKDGMTEISVYVNNTFVKTIKRYATEVE